MSWYLLLGTAGYLLGVPLAARLFYGRQRRQIISLEGGRRPDPVGYFEAHDRPGVAGAAVAAALFWPLAVPVYGIGRLLVVVVTARPRRSSYERRLRARHVHERIRELEAGLGIEADDPRGERTRS
ncbi:hypothetical protein [Streptomyces sp. MAR4 CNX-425]|uniref:hypothetical protein n=1 Tax=Streptomyces sp. MAR4 CNX-425 TaxID=3406343 RepID=UPI003B50F7FA